MDLNRQDDAAPPLAAPTLAAVAARAGVSPITVSRVVRLPTMVAAPTRARVEAAMRDLGYVPNQVAGSLASARSNAVGVLVPTIANSIFADTVQGLSDQLEPLGFAVILAQSRYDAVREDRMLAALLARRPEAIIMVGSPATGDGAALLRRARIPVVGICRTRRSTPSPGSTTTLRAPQWRGTWRRRDGSASRSSAATTRARPGAGAGSATRRRMPGCRSRRG
jgi:DNA-binding LacI/PurR family transcriptional regulator